MNRCLNCSHWLGFYGISQTKSEGWVRWHSCSHCGTFQKDDANRVLGLTKVEPSKAIFRTGP